MANHPSTTVTVEQETIDTLSCLAMDAVEEAGSGHPGTAMALAPLMYLLYRDEMRHSPAEPSWPNRDRFVLSAGHACIAQYAVLHLTGYDLSLDDLRRFRQWGSRTPGHPERESATPGIEITTGPLGQGLANGVGMALGERMLAARYNRPGFDLIDHRTFVIASDGDMMEGVSGEASSLAGHLGLGKLCVLYDDNRITIEGSTDLAFSEDVAGRYTAYGWHVQRLDDGWAVDDLGAAIANARQDEQWPSLIMVRTHIATGSPNAHDTAAAHGAPLGAEEVRATKIAMGRDPEARFAVPQEVYEHMDRRHVGEREAHSWQLMRGQYAVEHPDAAAELNRVLTGEYPENWHEVLPDFAGEGDMATRVAAGRCINALAERLPELVGGSGDLAPSTNTLVDGAASFSRGNFAGRNLHFGVREHAMGAIINGILAHGGLRPFGATFLVFSDYMRPSIRLAALMGLPAIYVFTHDSLALGEDGPTHQPIEQLAALRGMPGLRVVRPADPAETAVAWRLAIERTDGPTALSLSRQKVPMIDRAFMADATGVLRGGYTLAEPAAGAPDVILIATGAETHLAIEAQRRLADQGIAVRVVSMPCPELFLEQDQVYRDEVLPRFVWRRVSIEAGVRLGWERFVGPSGIAIGVDRFGASAPGTEVLERLGITTDAVVAAALQLMNAGVEGR
jgi:transketolase